MLKRTKILCVEYDTDNEKEVICTYLENFELIKIISCNLLFKNKIMTF